MARPPKDPAEVQSAQIGIRLTAEERERLDDFIKSAEHKAGLAPGSLSPGTYLRSVIVRHLTEAQEDMTQQNIARILQILQGAVKPTDELLVGAKVEQVAEDIKKEREKAPRNRLPANGHPKGGK